MYESQRRMVCAWQRKYTIENMIEFSLKRSIINQIIIDLLYIDYILIIIVFYIYYKNLFKPKNPYEPDSKYFDKAKNNFLVIVSFNPKVGWMLLLHTVLVIEFLVHYTVLT